jgi:hypothetical protein
MYWNPITRRFFLQSSGSLSLALPFLGSLAPKGFAQSAAEQRNLITFFKPNGCYPEDYFPHNPYADNSGLNVKALGGDMREFSLTGINGDISKVLGAEFNPLKSYLNIYRGLSTSQQNHNAFIPFATSSDTPSIDQVVARSSLYNKNGHGVTSIQATKDGYDKPSSYEFSNGQVRPVAATKDALVIFQRLFSGVATDGQNQQEAAQQAFQKIILEEKAVDQVLDDYKRLMANPRLSAADKQVVESYVAFIHDKQKTLAEQIAIGPDALMVDAGLIPQQPNAAVNENPLDLSETMVELMVAAIKTNIANTFNFQLATSVDETNFALPASGYNRGAFHGEISHSTGRRQDHLAVDRHLFGLVARAFKQLQSPISGDSGTTYADNTCIYVSGDMGAGSEPYMHQSFEAIALTLSGRNIPIKAGRCLAYSSNPNGEGYPHNQLLIGLMEAVGATDWRTAMTQGGLSVGDGFGAYGGTQRALGADAKNKPLPYIFT